MTVRTVRRSVLAAVPVLLVALAPAAPVSAHASLEESEPAANSVLVDPPEELLLDFDEDIEPALSSVRLYAADGQQIEIDRPRVGADASVVRVDAPVLGDGLYAVVWQVASADGHVVEGAFSFQVGTAASGDGDALVDRVRGSEDGGSLDAWYGAARFASLAGVVLAAGAAGWLLTGLGALVTARRAARLRWAAVVLLAVGSVATFVLFAARSEGASFGDVVATTTGGMLFTRSLLAVLLMALCALWAHRHSQVWRAAAGVVALAIAVSCSASGHANQLDPPVLAVAVDALHVLAMSVWLGGLVVLALADGALLREPEAVLPVRRFSAVAMGSVVVVVSTGVVQGLRLAGGLDDVTATDWGRLLAVKVTIVVAVVAIAGVSRWLLQHEGPGALRRTVVVEAVAIAVVLALAAGMVGLAPRAGVASRPFDEQLVSGGLIASVSISPGRVGANEVHILVTPPGGSLSAVDAATARVSLPAASIPASPVTLVGEGPNHFSGTITFPRSGDWTFDLVLTTGTADTLVTATVSVP